MVREDNLFDPTPGESTYVDTGTFDPKFHQAATTLSGTGEQGFVDPAIGNGNTTQVTPTTLTGDEQVSNVSGLLKQQEHEEMIIPDAPLTESELDTEFFRKGGSKQADRQSDRQARKDEGLRGSAKRQQRKADRRARKSSWSDSQI